MTIARNVCLTTTTEGSSIATQCLRDLSNYTFLPKH